MDEKRARHGAQVLVDFDIGGIYPLPAGRRKLDKIAGAPIDPGQGVKRQRVHRAQIKRFRRGSLGTTIAGQRQPVDNHRRAIIDDCQRIIERLRRDAAIGGAGVERVQFIPLKSLYIGPRAGLPGGQLDRQAGVVEDTLMHPVVDLIQQQPARPGEVQPALRWQARAPTFRLGQHLAQATVHRRRRVLRQQQRGKRRVIRGRQHAAVEAVDAGHAPAQRQVSRQRLLHLGGGEGVSGGPFAQAQPRPARFQRGAVPRVEQQPADTQQAARRGIVQAVGAQLVDGEARVGIYSGIGGVVERQLV